MGKRKKKPSKTPAHPKHTQDAPPPFRTFAAEPERQSGYARYPDQLAAASWKFVRGEKTRKQYEEYVQSALDLRQQIDGALRWLSYAPLLHGPHLVPVRVSPGASTAL